MFSAALGEIIAGNEWQKLPITIVYESDDNLERMQDILEQHEPADPPVTLYQIPTGSVDYKPMLKTIQVSGANNIIMDCSQKKIMQIMKQAHDLMILEAYEVWYCVNNFGRI